MEKFIVFFRSCSIENAISKDKEKFKIEKTKENDYDLKSIRFKLLEDPNQLNEFVSILKKNMDLEFLLVIDNKKDVCYIYFAKGDLKEIKAKIMIDISEAYKIITNDELFVSKFEDLRYISKIHQKNPKLN